MDFEGIGRMYSCVVEGLDMGVRDIVLEKSCEVVVCVN